MLEISWRRTETVYSMAVWYHWGERQSYDQNSQSYTFSHCSRVKGVIYQLNLNIPLLSGNLDDPSSSPDHVLGGTVFVYLLLSPWIPFTKFRNLRQSWNHTHLHYILCSWAPIVILLHYTVVQQIVNANEKQEVMHWDKLHIFTVSNSESLILTKALATCSMLNHRSARSFLWSGVAIRHNASIRAICKS